MIIFDKLEKIYEFNFDFIKKVLIKMFLNFN